MREGPVLSSPWSPPFSPPDTQREDLPTEKGLVPPPSCRRSVHRREQGVRRDENSSLGPDSRPGLPAADADGRPRLYDRRLEGRLELSIHLYRVAPEAR